MSRNKIQAERIGKSKAERYLAREPYMEGKMSFKEIIILILSMFIMFSAITWIGGLQKPQTLNKVNTQIELYSADK